MAVKPMIVTNTVAGSIRRGRSKLVSLVIMGLLASVAALGGCEVDSFLFDSSKTGSFEKTATTIPVLDRIDVIEEKDDYWARATPVTADDLIPSELQYVLFPGDVVTVSIYELYSPQVWSTTTRRVDAGGYYRVPELGDVRAAGLTQQQFEDALITQLEEKVMRNPQVDVVVEEGGGLRYTLSGFVQNTGMFTLSNPDLRLMDALSIAGGIPITTERIYIIRRVLLTDEMLPSFNKDGSSDPATKPADQPVDIDQMIEQLDQGQTTPPASPGMLATPNIQQDPAQDVVQPADQTPPSDQPAVDIDALEPVRVNQNEPPVDVDTVRPPMPSSGAGDSFIYVPEKGEWIRVPAGTMQPPAGTVAPDGTRRMPEMIVERIIEIDYQALAHGDNSFNVIIRPNDQIWVDGPAPGLVYIDGEINRSGVYQLPQTGTLTLSRLIASAGGLGAIAVAERVDLIRVVGKNREAVVRLDLAAIRQRTEPDVVLKPDDHIIIGTSFWATPMTIIRNGFRATYGFGFLLDRNFGNDVFGAPPEDNSF